ncbi:hypothetical protein BK816_04755 [Boudabousia tangfeifanii]|uniref:DUF7455 domain-containing protein n=1 Tax=Boudabousia tangfeifanii TaxID=1912795 RepID=A0A1D9MK55_9ACTO|nr:hypothetical protein [Boudabousia tangfeifanii]AOZ72685.1 hypothetical protein BK816_04755 [Boudabousia tangfeifanii]
MTEEKTIATAPEPETTLSSLDRCDACGAQAYVRVQVGATGQLLFCAHHARKHAPVLTEVAQIIEDQSDLLTASNH